MRSLLLMALLTTAVSCVTKTEEKSCTYNGEPCVEESQRTDMGHPRTLQEAILQVSVQSPVTITPYELEFLENTYDYGEVELAGNLYGCEAKTLIGTRLTYKITNGYLSLMEERPDGLVNIQVFERNSQLGKGVEGVWVSSVNYGIRKETTRLEIGHKNLKKIVECQIKI